MISILILTKKHLKLYNCIKSILKNSHNNFEIIVIDQST
ncbi:MAG: hypothetical protein UT84_C0031G0002 [Candidatus Curtissbacteria bacterium GW2011_GWA1_40_16]|uniref:Glycosyltransferase 2-like domain-containing protein n=1 Tax=Candidatus Curtissbacteria bacterium GW2011_GWA1_40_16 TaxID=1618405 RepID=A0A0G0UGU2_9BACT|nr:MAG: hypothetical protein UT84_C0031G0002 [Candidatus Curtissbacteria bacterium GW2011_GWA1_40_16]